MDDGFVDMYKKGTVDNHEGSWRHGATGATFGLMMPGVPLFLLTGHYSRELELAAFGSGICAVFSKHEDLDSLVARARLELHLQQPDNGHSSTQEGT